MNAKTILYCLAGILFIGLTAFSSYKKAEKTPTLLTSTKPEKMVDVVNCYTPVRPSSDARLSLIERLKKAGNNEERNQIMKEDGEAVLTPYIAAHLKSIGYDCFIETITFGYGNGQADSVTYARGWITSGIYNPELYARVTGGECFGEGVVVFATCSNLTSFKLFKPENEVVIGSGAKHMEFVIENGKDLDAYTNDNETSAILYEIFHLTGSDLLPGDVVNLSKMTINGIPPNPKGKYRT